MTSHDGHDTEGGGRLDDAILDDSIRRIVDVAQPEQIILFGSAARGDILRVLK